MTRSSALLRLTLGGIGVVQLILGVVFIFAPALFANMLGVKEAPAWVNWIFIMLGARSFGFAYGMFMAMRNPLTHIIWIRAMIIIQAIDWVGTLYFVANGSLTLLQVSSASFLPLIFIAVLTLRYPRQSN